MAFVALSLLLVGVTVLLYVFWKFSRADADISLLLKPTPKRDHFKDKVVWITGASSGIGEGVAKILARQGARLIISSRNRGKLENVQMSLNNGRNVKVLVVDLSKLENPTDVVKQAWGLYGHIDVLVNSAGISCRVPVEEVTDELLRTVMEVDFFGQTALTQAVLPGMMEHGCGQIVSVVSILAKLDFPLRAPLTAAKHAMNGYMSALRLDAWICTQPNLFIMYASQYAPTLLKWMIREKHVKAARSRLKSDLQQSVMAP
ncbi:dehydrogenase/reductase SDR family member 7-like isoform X2 [Corticium candelabrum]|uniref:dehydrogenase/reductase SDR family member 7-like isoform X2 n=1 Tax=Corticium candelabrum TaxID=121492 RepID=UPI002E253C06|nr:dehydrogenase/reductase SDR family member 7-like isoform X2 [Corticium candelabrum]